MKYVDSPDGDQLYISKHGRLFRVTSMFTDVDEANRHIASFPNEGVIAELDDLIILADNNDEGMLGTRGS